MWIYLLSWALYAAIKSIKAIYIDRIRDVDFKLQYGNAISLCYFEIIYFNLIYVVMNK